MMPLTSCMRANPFAVLWNFRVLFGQRPICTCNQAILAFLLSVGADFSTPVMAQTPSADEAAAFYSQLSGKWTRISTNAAAGLVKQQVAIAALQCRAARKIDPVKASKATGISTSISQRLSKLIIYQKLDTGLKRIDFGARAAITFTGLKTGTIRGGRKGYEISNRKGKITIAFGKLKKGNYRSTPVMIEGKALYLKCPEKKAK